MIKRTALNGNLLRGFLARQFPNVDGADRHAGEYIGIKVNCAERAACKQDKQHENDNQHDGSTAFFLCRRGRR